MQFCRCSMHLRSFETFHVNMRPRDHSLRVKAGDKRAWCDSGNLGNPGSWNKEQQPHTICLLDCTFNTPSCLRDEIFTYGSYPKDKAPGGNQAGVSVHKGTSITNQLSSELDHVAGAIIFLCCHFFGIFN